MLTWIVNLFCYLAIVLPSSIWQTVFGSQAVKKWWDSRYR